MRNMTSKTTNLEMGYMASLEIRLEDFRNKKDQVNSACVKDCGHERLTFTALTSPDGMHKNTEGYVVFNINEKTHSVREFHNEDYLTCILNVIDVDGNAKYPLSFSKCSRIDRFLENSHSEPYLQRSFILERADELLLDGVLTLRCDIYFTCMAETNKEETLLSWAREVSDAGISELIAPFLMVFMAPLPNVIACHTKVSKIGIKEPISIFRVFDLSSQVLTLPQFCMSKDLCDISGVLPPLTSPFQPRHFSWTEENDANIVINSLFFKVCTPILSFLQLGHPRNGLGLSSISPMSPFKCRPNLMVKICCTRIVISRISAVRHLEFDSQTITLPHYEELRRSPGLHGVYSVLSFLQFRSLHKNLGENNCHMNTMEHIFVFDTDPDRFVISVDENNDLGTKLLDASPVIRGCVTTAMKEQREKRIDLSIVKSNTFQRVLYYIHSGLLLFSDFPELMNVYKMAHMYLFADLLQKCNGHMLEFIKKTPEVVYQLIKTAGRSSHEYYLLREFLENHALDDIDLDTV